MCPFIHNLFWFWTNSLELSAYSLRSLKILLEAGEDNFDTACIENLETLLNLVRVYILLAHVFVKESIIGFYLVVKF
jgi:hypothetical protein